MIQLRVTLLGTGIPDPQPDRLGSSTLVEAGRERFLFDCGRCALQRLFQTGTPVHEVSHLFLSHLHSDHTVGIPDLWLTPWVMGRKVPFSVWGPIGTQKMMSKLEEAFEFDVQIRPVHDLLPPNAAKIVARDVQEGVVYEKSGVKVIVFEVDHHPIKPSFGYRVEYGGKSVVLSGDTRFSENLIRFSAHADLLILNVAAARPEDLRDSDRLRSIMDLHLSPEEGGRIFERTKPKLAVYTHMVLFSVPVGEIVTRTRQTYTGPLEIGEDLMVFDVGETVKIHRPSNPG